MRNKLNPFCGGKFEYNFALAVGDGMIQRWKLCCCVTWSGNLCKVYQNTKFGYQRIYFVIVWGSKTWEKFLTKSSRSNLVNFSCEWHFWNAGFEREGDFEILFTRTNLNPNGRAFKQKPKSFKLNQKLKTESYRIN